MKQTEAMQFSSFGETNISMPNYITYRWLCPNLSKRSLCTRESLRCSSVFGVTINNAQSISLLYTRRVGGPTFNIISCSWHGLLMIIFSCLALKSHRINPGFSVSIEYCHPHSPVATASSLGGNFHHGSNKIICANIMEYVIKSNSIPISHK